MQRGEGTNTHTTPRHTKSSRSRRSQEQGRQNGRQRRTHRLNETVGLHLVENLLLGLGLLHQVAARQIEASISEVTHRLSRCRRLQGQGRQGKATGKETNSKPIGK